MTAIPFSGYVQKFSTAAQAGQAPDIIRIDNAPDTQGLAAQGLLTDLTSKISAADKADFVPAALKGGEYNGKIYSVPQTVDALALYYNKALFKAGRHQEPARHAGPARSRLPEVRRRQGNLPERRMRTGSRHGSGATEAAWSTCPRSRSSSATTKSIAGWSAFNSLFQNKCTFANKDYTNNYTNMQTAFKNGQVAMIVNGPWASTDMLSGPAFKSSTNLGVAVIPPGPGGQGSPIGGGALAISRNSQNVQAAYTFIKWFTIPAQQAVIAAKNNDLPSHISAYKLRR